uniref:Reverse transcriptase domain-containing protein n=1 Tax=Tanacetum cinerariifolium TaxID=118510 RepID=A0A6L2M1H5_TANCI|nr:reverse transcriptase domain-containing protein [Tanacetum cinerariifolium]
MTFVGARETVGNQVVQKTRIECFIYKEYGDFAKECRKLKRTKAYKYHKEKMMLCKQESKCVSLSAEQDEWLHDTNDEPDKQELKAHYIYLAKIQEVLTVNSGPTYDAEPLEHVQSNDDYNVFATKRQHYEQPQTINETYVVNTIDSNVIPNSLNMCDNDKKDNQYAHDHEDEHEFHGLSGDDANKHLDKFLHVTQSIKVNEVTDDALRMYLFPYSLTHHATTWFDRFPRNSINTFDQMAKMFLRKHFPPSMVTKLRNEITNFRQCPDDSLFEAWEHYKISINRCPNHNMLPVTQIDSFYNGLTLRHRDTINAAAGGTFMKRRPEECYDLIENMTAHHNDWDTSAQRSESSSSITSSSYPEIVALKAKMAEINKNLMKVLQVNQQVKSVAPSCETCGGPHSYNDCPATVGQTQNAYVVGAYQGGNSYQPQGSGTLPSNTVTNPKEDLKGITTRSGTAYQGPKISTTSSSYPQVVERETEVTKDTGPPTNNGSTKDVQPSVVQIETPIPNSKHVVALVAEPVVALASASKPNQKPSIPYPSKLQDQKLCDKANDQKEKNFKIFEDLNFNISFANALILMPKFGPTIKSRELTLRVNNEAVTFNLDQTSRYLANYNDMTANQIDLIDMSCEEYSQEVLGFSDLIASGNPTPYYNPIISTSSPTLTPFGDSDFLLEEVDAFLALEDDPTSPEVDHSYYDTEGGHSCS